MTKESPRLCMQTAAKSFRPGREEFMSQGGGQSILEPGVPIPRSIKDHGKAKKGQNNHRAQA